MISFLSDTDKRRRQIACQGFLYLMGTLFSAVFAAVYEQFSHGVYSDYMIYAFLFLMVGGALPFWGLSLSQWPLPSDWACKFYHSGLATLTVGSHFQGVLEIYGTTNQLVWIYWLVGWTLVMLGLIIYLLGNKK